MKNYYFYLIGMAAAVLLSSCGTAGTSARGRFATELEQRNQPASVTVKTLPAGASVYMDGRLVSTTTPAILQLPASVQYSTLTKKDLTKIKQSSSVKLQIVKDGYETVTDVVEPRIEQIRREQTIVTNYVYCAWPENLIYQLKPNAQAYRDDPTIPAGGAQERVSRDNAGQTSLERTVIRWYFDSDPKGARVFWRVISSVPSEVKNTNELLLGSTPFEETRSFNILGLTYANSRDVQIEIKVTRRGYVDQVKRFNVRQAIDQQEISSFFDLVKE